MTQISYQEQEAIKFNYMMLSRLKMDVEYFLNYGKGSIKVLYYGGIERHISEMKKLWNGFIEKPEWLTMEQIEDYENRMLNYKTN